MKLFFLEILVILFFVNNTQGKGFSNSLTGEQDSMYPESYVIPINWERFDFSKNPNDEDAINSRDLLLNSAKYGLKWIAGLPKYTGGLYNLGGINEENIRPPASEVVGLAVVLQTGIYNAEISGPSKQEAINRTVLLIKSIGRSHKCNTNNGWGDQWQSALWCGLAGQAAYLMWDHLDSDTKKWIAGMVEYEANRFYNYIVPYYRNKEGQIIISGDTKAEENSWNSSILQLAISIMPDHPNIEVWKYKCVELMVSSYSRPSDVNKNTIIDGISLKNWLNGSNLEENGTLINHGFIHNDYMCTVEQSLRSCLLFSLGNIDVPESAYFNANIVYDALVNLNFNSPPYESPGGTMYIESSPEQYYPKRTDWSKYRYDIYYTLDVFARILGFDKYADTDGLIWERLRGTRLLSMQNRHENRQIYASGEWNNYSGKEQLAAWQFGDAYLLKWLYAQGVLSSVASWNLIKPKLTTINDDDENIHYSSGWTDNNSAPNRINNDEHYTNTPGDYMQFVFTGTEMKWVATKFSNRGQADVYIDDVYDATVDLFNSSALYKQEVYTKSQLTNEEHTIKITCKGAKQDNSTDYYIDADAFILSDNTVTNVVATNNNDFRLKVYPNPVSDIVDFEYNQEVNRPITLIIYNSIGVAVIKKDFKTGTSTQKIRIDLRNQQGPLKSGIYIYQFSSNNYTETGKINFQKNE